MTDMDITRFIDIDTAVGLFKDLCETGLLPGFMLGSLLHLAAYAVFRALALLNTKN